MHFESKTIKTSNYFIRETQQRKQLEKWHFSMSDTSSIGPTLFSINEENRTNKLKG